MPDGSMARWLAELGLPQYADLLDRERVDLSMLHELTEDDLEKLGIPLGHRKLMLKAIAAMRHGGKATVPTAARDAYTPPHLAQRILVSRSALEGERKLVSVLFCDIAQSAQLATRIGADAMHALLNRFFELALAEVHRFEGTINQFLGDGFMALFGAPLAYEDHARRALLAALAIRQRLRDTEDNELGQLRMRIGINTGTVVVGKIGDNLRMDYTAVGDTTNLAARLEQAAVPDTICVGAATQRTAATYFEFRELGLQTLKGIVQPVEG